MSEVKDKAVRTIFRGGTILFVGVILSKLFGLMFRVLVGRTLGAAEYGVITVMMSAFSFMTTFGHMGIHDGVQRYVAYYRGEGNNAKMRGTARSGYLMILIPALIVSVSVFILSPWISTDLLDEPRLLWPLRMAAIALPFWGIAKVSLGITNGFEKMQYKVYVKKLWVNASEVLLAFILIYLGYSYIGAAFAYAFGFLTASFLGVYYAYKLEPEIFSSNLNAEYDVPELWQHSWPLFAAGIFGLITGHIDTFMLQYFEGAESVGLYQAAYPFAVLLLASHSIFNSIFLSRASFITSKSRDELGSIFKVVVNWMTIITLPVFLLLMVYPQGALILFGSEFLEVENVLRVLLIGFLLQAVIGPAKKVYQAVDMTKIITMLSITLAIANLGLNLILIPLYGVMGAAIASTGAFTLIFVIKTAFIYKIIGVQPFKTSALKAIFSSGSTIFLIYALSNLIFQTTPYWFIIIGFIIFAVLYPLIFISIGGLTEEDLIIIEEIEDKFSIDLTHIKKLV